MGSSSKSYSSNASNTASWAHDQTRNGGFRRENREKYIQDALIKGSSGSSGSKWSDDKYYDAQRKRYGDEFMRNFK